MHISHTRETKFWECTSISGNVVSFVALANFPSLTFVTTRRFSRLPPGVCLKKWRNVPFSFPCNVRKDWAILERCSQEELLIVIQFPYAICANNVIIHSCTLVIVQFYPPWGIFSTCAYSISKSALKNRLEQNMQSLFKTWLWVSRISNEMPQDVQGLFN